MKFQITTHWKKFRSKPKEKEPGFIRNLKYCKVETVSIEQLAKILKDGRTITAAVHDVEKHKDSEEDKYITKATFISQQIFALDIDHANMDLSELKYKLNQTPFKPAMIYKTFSYSETNKRWRVIFVSKTKYTDQKQVKKIYQYLIAWMAKDYGNTPHLADVDTTGYDGARLTYGAKEIVEVNSDAICDFSIALTSASQASAQEVILHIKRAKQERSDEIEKAKKNKIKTHLADESSDVENRIFVSTVNPIANDIESLYNLICRNLENYEFEDKPDIVDYVDSHLFIDKLKITDIIKSDVFYPQSNELFNCILHGHEDRTPSANISITKDGTEREFYFCYGCESLFNTFDLIDHIFEAYAKLNGQVNTKRQTLTTIYSLLDIELGSKFQHKVLRQLTADRRYINKLTKDHPFLKVLTPAYKGLYKELFDIAEMKVSFESLIKDDEDYAAVFIATNNFISEHLKGLGIRGSDPGGVNKKINKLVRIGLIDKIDWIDLTPQTQQTLELYKQKMLDRESLHIKPWLVKNPSVYKLKYLTNSLVENAIKTVALEKRYAVRAKGQGRAQTTAMYGEDRSREVYPQWDTDYTPKQQLYIKLAEKAANKLIEEKQYFTELELDAAIDKSRNHFNKKEKEKMRLKLLTAIMLALNLQKKKCNKELRQRFNIPSDVKCHILFVAD